MLLVKRLPVVAVAAGLAFLAGCGAATSGHPGAGAVSPPGASASGGDAPGAPGPVRTPGQSPGGPAPSASCAEAGTHLTSVRTAQHAGFDRVVFEFSGSLPAYDVSAQATVYA